MTMKKLVFLSVILLAIFLFNGLAFGLSVLDKEYVNEAKIDWKQFAGKELYVVAVNNAWIPALIDMLPEFEELTGIKVTLDMLPEDELRRSRLLDVSTGTGSYDIIHMDQSIAEYAKAGWLKPIDQYLSNASLTDLDWYDLNDFPQSAIDFCSYMGNIYGIPSEGGVVLLFYRKDVYEKVGISSPQNMDDLWDNCIKIKDSDCDIPGMILRGIRGFGQNVWTFSPFFRSYGGEWFDTTLDKLDKNSSSTINNSEGIAAAEMYVNLLREFGPAGAVNYGVTDCVEAFQRGNGAQMADFGGQYFIYIDPANSQVVDKVGVSMFPAGPTGLRRNQFWHWVWSINSFSKNQDAAWLWIQWASSKRVSYYSNLMWGTMPRNSAWSDPLTETTIPHPEWRKVVEETWKTTDALCAPYTFDFPEWGNEVSIELNSAIAGMKTPEQAMNDAAKKVTEIIRKNR